MIALLKGVVGRRGWGPGEGAEGESQRPSPFPGFQNHVKMVFSRNRNQHVIQAATHLTGARGGFLSSEGTIKGTVCEKKKIFTMLLPILFL